MLLERSTWDAIDVHLRRSKGIIIPIGSCEQHGPNGLLGTDFLCPEIIARACEKDHPELLIAPTFNIGVAQHHLGFAGTITLRPSTFIAAMQDWIASLTRHGFQRLFFLNGHGGNTASIEAAFSEAYAPWSFKGVAAPFALKRMNWWELPGVMGVCKKLYGGAMGSHATPAEVAVTYAAYPETEKHPELRPQIAPLGPIRDAADYRERFPDGRIGSDPNLAKAKDGEKIIAKAAEALAAQAKAFFAEIDAPPHAEAAE